MIEEVKDWDGISLEDLLRGLAKENKRAEALSLIKMLPDEKQKKYRNIWKEESDKRLNPQGIQAK